MKKIDLHTHSWYSDGNLSPCALVEEASRKGLEIVALTDHDGTFGIDEALAAGEHFGVQVIGGVEFSSYLETLDCTMHILGLGIDHRQKHMRERILWMREKRKERNDRMLDIFRRMGISLTKEELQVYPGQEYIGKPNIARALVKRGYAASVAQVFRSERLLASPQLKIVRRDRVTAAEAIDLIHGAGGMAVLAHPYKVFWEGRISPAGRQFDDPAHLAYREKMTVILDKLVALGLDGMECFYSSHGREETEYLCRLAQQRGLRITAGSDYHGSEMREDVRLAGCFQGWEEEQLPWAVEEAAKAAADALLNMRR